MTVRFGRLGAWAAAAVLCLATAAAGEPLPKLPLKPDERVYVSANGCAFIYPIRQATAEQITKLKADTARQTWQGTCRNGLAHGKGRIGYPARDTYEAGSYPMEFFYGRQVRMRDDGYGKTWFFTEDGRSVAAGNGSDPEAPVWRESPSTPSGPRGTEIVAESRLVFTTMSCYLGDRGCEYKIYSANLGANQPPGTNTPCPNINTYVGCDVLWRQITGSMIATYRSVRAEVERRDPVWRAELTQMNAAREARFAALETGAGQAFERSQAAVQTDAGKADREFKAKLTTANAGQLYAMADQFERAGDSEKAGDALRALLSRFPDHALAVTAAQHLSALPPPRPVSTECNASVDEAQASMALRGAMDRIPGSNAVWQYEAVMATIQRSAGAWARCPTHPSSAAKIRNYRAAYLSAASRCAMVSPTGACAPNMH